MFHTEGIVFIAVLCVVNAAFTVNIPENNVGDVEKCANMICDQQCRQMGFAVGKCLGFTCECDNFTKSNDVGDDVNADDENANIEELSDCNPAACDQLCRRLKFPGGVCVNGRCKCDNFRRDLEFANDDFKDADSNDIEEGLSDCNPAGCDQLCRRLKFSGGACVNGHCKCDNFRQVLEIFVNNDFETVDKKYIGNELSDCNPAACDQLCRRLKFPGGVCVNGRCKCDNFRRELVLLSNNYFDTADNDDIKELSDCNPAACDQLCRRLKFPGGVCVNGRCKCDNFRHDLEPIINHQIGAELSCLNAVCNQICRRLGFLKGECAGDRCECSNFFTQNKQPQQIAFIKVNEDDDEMSNELSVCDPSSCYGFCHLLKYQRGICLSGQCWCTNSLQAEGNRKKILKEPVCDEKECNIRCRKMHFLGGFCQLYKCVCY